jgi:hypothetical protein
LHIKRADDLESSVDYCEFSHTLSLGSSCFHFSQNLPLLDGIPSPKLYDAIRAETPKSENATNFKGHKDDENTRKESIKSMSYWNLFCLLRPKREK